MHHACTKHQKPPTLRSRSKDRLRQAQAPRGTVVPHFFAATKVVKPVNPNSTTNYYIHLVSTCVTPWWFQVCGMAFRIFGFAAVGCGEIAVIRMPPPAPTLICFHVLVPRDFSVHYGRIFCRFVAAFHVSFLCSRGTRLGRTKGLPWFAWFI